MGSDFHKKRRSAVLVVLICSLLRCTTYSAKTQTVILQLPADDQQMITAQIGPGVAGTALPSKPIDDVSSSFPLHDAASIYQVVAGPNAGKVQMLGLARVIRPSGGLAWRFQLSPTLGSSIHKTPDGDLIVSAISDIGEGVVVITTPANPFILKGMMPGESRSYVERVVINELHDPGDQKFFGSLDGTYTYLGSDLVTEPAALKELSCSF